MLDRTILAIVVENELCEANSRWSINNIYAGFVPNNDKSYQIIATARDGSQLS